MQEHDLPWLLRQLLNEYENGAAQPIPESLEEQARLLRVLMNRWMPKDEPQAVWDAQDAALQAQLKRKGIVDWTALPATARDPRIILWQGDITRLNADAIVNAANSRLLGCFVPCHRCIDNAIHSAAGMQLRAACAALMTIQGHEEPTGTAKLTAGFNLPSKYVLHTVGPIVDGVLTQTHCEQLASCYRACLKLAQQHRLDSVAFCCISTGEFGFPNQKAAEIAAAVTDMLNHSEYTGRVIFNVFKDADLRIYRRLLGEDRAARTAD